MRCLLYELHLPSMVLSSLLPWYIAGRTGVSRFVCLCSSGDEVLLVLLSDLAGEGT